MDYNYTCGNDTIVGRILSHWRPWQQCPWIHNMEFVDCWRYFLEQCIRCKWKEYCRSGYIDVKKLRVEFGFCRKSSKHSRWANNAYHFYWCGNELCRIWLGKYAWQLHWIFFECPCRLFQLEP